jgi:protein associated with RNAse G/E
MDQIHLYRKRYVPEELIYLKDDIILYQSDDIIITKWNTLKPRCDIFCGVSAYFMGAGYKVSKIYNKSMEVVYWYCDIIEIKKDFNQNSIISEDLMIDVKVYEDGRVEVVDVSELADGFDSHKISAVTVSRALRSLDALLKIIYSGNFNTLQQYINDAERSAIM